MTSRSCTIIGVVAALVASAVSPAWARNPHCAGGIQYVVQSGGEKQKQNFDESKRLMLKAVQQLEQCATEDPKDYEAIGYLGWAYADVDSMCKAGRAFQTALDGLGAKGDKKKLELVTNNRESYWATKFNDGIAKITTAQEQYADYTAAPKSPAEEASRKQAGMTYDAALVSLQYALCLKPGDSRTVRNLATVHALRGEYLEALRWVDEGLKAAPTDSALLAMKKGLRGNEASRLVESKKYDEAITYYSDLIKTDPNNGDLYSGLADAQFNKANELKGDAKKPVFKAAGDGYAKAATIKKTQADLPFNAALSYQNAGEWALAEGQWKAALAIKPDDVQALTAYAQTLSELKKYPQAVAVAEQALARDGKNKDHHRLLSAMYSKAGDNDKSRQEAMVYLALSKGAKGSAGTPSGAAGQKLKGTSGDPEEVFAWDADGQPYETWFYWSKGQAFHFSNGTQVAKSDWSAALAKK